MSEEVVTFARIKDEANGVVNTTVTAVVGRGSVGEEVDYDPKLVF